MH
ncbi:Protein of unknown function [Bacillus cereus]|jgi:ribosome biogenesis protein NSA1